MDEIDELDALNALAQEGDRIFRAILLSRLTVVRQLVVDLHENGWVYCVHRFGSWHRHEWLRGGECIAYNAVPPSAAYVHLDDGIEYRTNVDTGRVDLGMSTPYLQDRGLFALRELAVAMGILDNVVEDAIETT